MITRAKKTLTAHVAIFMEALSFRICSAFKMGTQYHFPIS